MLPDTSFTSLTKKENKCDKITNKNATNMKVTDNNDKGYIILQKLPAVLKRT